MVNLTPEQKAREQIDIQLKKAGWFVQSKEEVNFSKGIGIAIREESQGAAESVTAECSQVVIRNG